MIKVLVIEDDELVADNILELLSESEYKVIKALNGEEGLKKASIEIPDIIICDVSMPGISGYDVLEKLLESSSTSSIPFIFLTARTSKSDIRFGMEMGADDYISKPFTPEELFKTIETRLKKKRISDDIAKDRIKELSIYLAATLPHEMRTPLNGILTASQYLMSYFSSMDKEEATEMHKTIFYSAKRLEALIYKFLNNAELEMILRNQELIDTFKQEICVDIANIIKEEFIFVADTYHRIDDLRFDFENTSILCPEKYFRIICREIAENSMKFSKPQTIIQIKTKVVNEYIVMEIIDAGKGMSNEQIENIGLHTQFDRKLFEQQGSGLGLAIVRKILQIIGGNFEIDNSTINQTTVRISFWHK